LDYNNISGVSYVARAEILAVQSRSVREAEKSGATIELTVDKCSIAGYSPESNDESVGS
jgi:hypothetical protein